MLRMNHQTQRLTMEVLAERDIWEQTDLATDVQSDSEVSSMRQTDHSQEVSEVRAGICGAGVNLILF